MNQEQQALKEIWLVIQQIKIDRLLTREDEHTVYEVVTKLENPEYPPVRNQLKIIKKLEHLQALKVIREYYVTSRGTSMADSVNFSHYQDVDPKGILINVLQPKFDELYAEYSSYSSEPITPKIEISEYRILVKDRGIWVNEFLLSKPHAAGKNMLFFEHLIEHVDKSIKLETLPSFVQVEIGTRSFSKILHDLGFKGEILKAFFPARGKNQLIFRKEVSLKQLEKDGVNAELLLQELRVAHIKSNPK